MRLIRKFSLVIFLFVIIGIIFFYFVYKGRLVKNSDVEVKMEEELVKEESFDVIKVDIKGAVNNPGVYEVNEDTIVNELIEKAGGLREDADTSVINLAKKLKNEDLIIIYTKEEVENSNIVDTVVKVVDKECVCPNIVNDGCINNEINDTISNYDGESVNGGLVNINTASKEELMKLSGIGDAKADAIIEYRKSNKFNSIEDIKNVTGIGQALYEKIKDYIEV